MPEPLSPSEIALVAAAAALISVNFVRGMLKRPAYRRSREAEATAAAAAAERAVQKKGDRSVQRAAVGRARRGPRAWLKARHPEVEQLAVGQPLSGRSRAMASVHSLLVNGVTLVGVYHLHWPFGTALALYWSETFLSIGVLIVLLSIWKQQHQVERTAVSGAGQTALGALIFTSLHLVFILFFVGLMIPRMAPAESFARGPYMKGLAWIALLIGINAGSSFLTLRSRTAGAMQSSVASFMRRMTVLHLTIVFGTFAMLIFDTPRAVFAVFAGLKTLADLSWESTDVSAEAV